MFPEQQNFTTQELKNEIEKSELIDSSTIGRRRIRNSNFSNQIKRSHQSNHLHYSSNDNQSNLNHSFQRNSNTFKFRSKMIRKNQRTNESSLLNSQYQDLIYFDPEQRNTQIFDGKIDRNKYVFNQFDSGTIDRNLIDHILRDKQQLINKPMNKQFEKRMNNNKFDKIKSNGELLVNQENTLYLINEYSHEHKLIDDYQIKLQNSINDPIMNHPTNNPSYHQINDQINGQIDVSTQVTKSLQGSILANVTILPSNSPTSNILSKENLFNSSLNKSNSINDSENSSINLTNRSLNKSLNKSQTKPFINRNLICKSPANPGRQNNGFCRSNNQILNIHKLNKNLINDQSIHNKSKLHANFSILNCFINNNSITNLNLKSSQGSNSNLNTILNASLNNMKTNQLFKILPNAIVEYNNKDIPNGALNLNQHTNQQSNYKINSQIDQSQNNQQVNQSIKNSIQPIQLFNHKNDRISTGQYVEQATSEQTLMKKLNDISMNSNQFNKCLRSEFANELKNDLKNDPRDEHKNEPKNCKKSISMVCDNNSLKSELNIGRENSMQDTQFNNSQTNSSINGQVNQHSNHFVNNQASNAQQLSVFDSNVKIVSSSALKHLKPVIKNNESERYVCEKKSNYHQYSNYYNYTPFFKPPKYQDKIMTPDSYQSDHKEQNNWKQRKGNFNRFYGDKKQFYPNRSNNAHFVSSVSIPHYPKMIHSYHDIVSNQIWKLYILLRQTPESYERKIELRQSLYKALKNDLVHDLYLVGSSLNGLGTITSDVDMCLLLPQNLGDIDQSTQAIPILKIVMDIIARKLDFIDNIRLIEAKVPILKFSDKKGNIEIDLNINNIVGIRNTQLVKCYTRLDWRITPLAIAIKAWAHFNQINNAHKKTISSYTLVLMLIHYLQVDCSPPILPCLHSMMPNSFRTDSDVKKLNLFEDLPEFRSDNKQSLSELFIGFLDYYGNRFDYSSDVISVRTGRIIRKEVAREYRSPKNTPTQWHYICCEEPFDRTNTARSVSDNESFNRVTKCFQNSYCRIKSTHNLVAILNLEHLFGLNGLNSSLSNSNLNNLGSSEASCRISNAK